MLKSIKKSALLLVLSGVLTGFLLEQCSVFQQVQSFSWCDSDCEQKDNAESKKFGEDEKVSPKELNLNQKFAFGWASYLKTISGEPRSYYSSGHTCIFTPPPERV